MFSRITGFITGAAPSVDSGQSCGGGGTVPSNNVTAPTGSNTMDDSKSPRVNYANPVPQPVVVITGANRGLGLEFVKQLLEGGHEKESGMANNCIVVATCRNPDGANELKRLKSLYGNRLDVAKLDVVNKQQIDELVKRIGETYGRLDLLINNAGILRHSESTPDTPDKVPADTIREVINVNTVAPVELTRAFMPLLKKTHNSIASSQQPSGGGGDKNETYVRVIYITSTAGSMTIAIPGFTSYAMSKSALNRWVVSAPSVYPEIGFGLIHPGWVDTDMGRAGGEPEIKPKDSIAGMLRQLPKVTRERSGKQVIGYDGAIVPF